jgi:hypothetical protein
MSDADLRDIEEPGIDGLGPMVRRVLVLRLCAEVRRLRGLIVEAEGVEVDGALYDLWCGHCVPGARTLTPHEPDCPIGALAAEARAIREEQGLT